MADVNTLVRAPGESLSAFNKRLKEVCRSIAVTDVQLEIVDGQPMVTLLAETEEATEEDVELAGKDCDFAVGEQIPADDPVLVKVLKVEALSAEDANTAEQRLEGVYQLAAGAVTSHLHASGPEWPPGAMPGRLVHYVAVAFVDDAAAPADDKDIAEGLRTKGSKGRE